jgi:hypothetical protein
LTSLLLLPTLLVTSITTTSTLVLVRSKTIAATAVRTLAPHGPIIRTANASESCQLVGFFGFLQQGIEELVAEKALGLAR